MRRITPATSDNSRTISLAVERLREARTLLREAGARRAAHAAGKAVNSAEGAARHVQHRIQRSNP